ncbi:hypothetical protein [Hydrogenophaga soli]
MSNHPKPRSLGLQAAVLSVGLGCGVLAHAQTAAPVDVPVTRGTVDLSGFQSAIQQARPPVLKPEMAGESTATPAPTATPPAAPASPAAALPPPSGPRPRTVAEWAAYNKAREQAQHRTPAPATPPAVPAAAPATVHTPSVPPTPPTPPVAKPTAPLPVQAPAAVPVPAEAHAPSPVPTAGKPVPPSRPSGGKPTEEEQLQQVAEKLLSAIAAVNEKQRKDAAGHKTEPAPPARPKRATPPDAGLDPSTETLVTPRKH